MAIVLCKECKASISSSATKCPQCGAKMPKKTSLLTWFLGAAICAIVVIARDPSADKSDVVSKPNGTLTAPRPAWKYPAENDRMTGKPTKQASVDSVNSLALGWPYHGKNFGSILISAKAGQETTVLVSLEKGQTMCRSFDTSCKIEVKFDNAQPIRFSGIGLSPCKTWICTPG